MRSIAGSIVIGHRGNAGTKGPQAETDNGGTDRHVQSSRSPLSEIDKKIDRSIRKSIVRSIVGSILTPRVRSKVRSTE